MLLLVTRKAIAHAIAYRDNFTSERMVRSYGLYEPPSGVRGIPLHGSDDDVLRCFIFDEHLPNGETALDCEQSYPLESGITSVSRHE